MPYYMIFDRDDPATAGQKPTRLVQAKTNAQAIKHCASRFSAVPAKINELAELLVGPGALPVERAADD